MHVSLDAFPEFAPTQLAVGVLNCRLKFSVRNRSYFLSRRTLKNPYPHAQHTCRLVRTETYIYKRIMNLRMYAYEKYQHMCVCGCVGRMLERERESVCVCVYYMCMYVHVCVCIYTIHMYVCVSILYIYI